MPRTASTPVAAVSIAKEMVLIPQSRWRNAFQLPLHCYAVAVCSAVTPAGPSAHSICDLQVHLQRMADPYLELQRVTVITQSALSWARQLF